MSSGQSQVQKVNFISGMSAIIAIIVTIYFSIVAEMPPDSASLQAPAGDFSAARALLHLQQIAKQPHPTGSDENKQVRAYLIQQLQALGLKPEIQSGMGFNKKWGAIAPVHNILVRLPGRVAGKALLLVAHYDSVPGGPGAADDGASVAAILETLRALSTAPPLQNELICLLTDGEELGLLGSELFVNESPLAKNVGLVLNFEFRGNSGPMLMFETSVGNGKLIEGLANSVKLPVANSLSYEVYKMMPNDTDLTNFKAAGIPGLNFSAIDGETSYHTQLDRPELLSKNTLQHEGELMLPLVRYFGTIPLNDLSSTDRVYFNVPGLGLMHYSVSWAVPLCALAALLFLSIVVVGLRRKKVRLVRMLMGVVIFLLLMGVFASLCQLLWTAVVWLHPSYQLQFEPYNCEWYLFAFVSLVVGLFSTCQRAMKRWILPDELGLAAALCWIVLLAVACIRMPGASFILTWPLLPILVTYAFLFSDRFAAITANKTMWILLVGTIPAILLFAPLVLMLYIGLSPQMSLVVGLVVTLLLGIMTPLLATLTGRFVLPFIPLLAGILFLAMGAATASFDLEHPRPMNVFYAFDGVSGQAWWLSRDAKLDPWSQQLFQPTSQRREVPEIFGQGKKVKQWWINTAPDIGIKAPVIELVQDAVVENTRHVAVRVYSLRQAARLLVSIEGVDVIGSTVQGVDYTNRPKSGWTLVAQGMAENALKIDFQVVPGKPFQLRVIDETIGLSSFKLPLRSAEFITEMSGSMSDSLLAVQVKKFN